MGGASSAGHREYRNHRDSDPPSSLREMEKALFIIFAIIAVASALNILPQRNPMYSALSLVGTLVSLSALYIMLRAQFIAAIQIVVYAGAIMVLFVFVIMLL